MYFVADELILMFAEGQHQPGIPRQGVALELVGNHRSISKQIYRPDPGSPLPVNRQNKRNSFTGREGIFDHLVPFLHSLFINAGNLTDVVYGERNGIAYSIVHLQEFSAVVGNNQAPDIAIGAVHPEILLHRVEHINRIFGACLRRLKIIRD
ncbi:hypothetical protein D3C75_722260 [compost metagenome]